MAEFARYYIKYLEDLWRNIVDFFTGIFATIEKIFVDDLPGYFSALTFSATKFDAWGWFFFILMFLSTAIFIFFVSYRVAMLIRRFVIFRAKEVDKDQLIEELAREKDKNARLTVEKNQLYALKVNATFGGGFAGNKVEEEVVKDLAVAEIIPESRFSKLISIDEEFSIPQHFISNAEVDSMSLSDIVDRFVNFAASNQKLYYDKAIIRRFLAGMATSKVLILEGISGTGKTSLPYAFSKFLGNDPSIISVQPSWRDRGDIMGYLNEFTKTYNETTFLSAVYEATYKCDPSIVILDEMNLARIEYYFAEFLSIMEMPNKNEWLIDVVANEQNGDPKNLKDGKLLVPQSIWFVGTANQDDSTFTITDKVYDRAITLDLNNRADYFDAPITEGIKLSNYYLEVLFSHAEKNYTITDKNRENLKKIDSFVMDKFKITFGNRIMRQINKFVPIYCACGGSEVEAIDFLLMSKIFRKFTSLNLIFLKKELKALITLLDSLFGKDKCPMSIEYINSLSEKS